MTCIHRVSWTKNPHDKFGKRERPWLILVLGRKKFTKLRFTSFNKFMFCLAKVWTTTREQITVHERKQMHRLSVQNKKAAYLYFSFSVRHLLFVTSKSTWVSVDHHNSCSVLASRFFGSALATAWTCLRGISTRTTSWFRRLLPAARVLAGTSLRKGKQMRYNGRKDIEQLAYKKLFHSLPLD